MFIFSRFCLTSIASLRNQDTYYVFLLVARISFRSFLFSSIRGSDFSTAPRQRYGKVTCSFCPLSVSEHFQIFGGRYGVTSAEFLLSGMSIRCGMIKHGAPVIWVGRRVSGLCLGVKSIILRYQDTVTASYEIMDHNPQYLHEAPKTRAVIRRAGVRVDDGSGTRGASPPPLGRGQPEHTSGRVWYVASALFGKFDGSL